MLVTTCVVEFSFNISSQPLPLFWDTVILVSNAVCQMLMDLFMLQVCDTEEDLYVFDDEDYSHVNLAAAQQKSNNTSTNRPMSKLFRIRLINNADHTTYHTFISSITNLFPVSLLCTRCLI
jgi:hypothetical protein